MPTCDARPFFLFSYIFFFFNDTATTEIYTLSLHDALPIYRSAEGQATERPGEPPELTVDAKKRSEEQTSELQSQSNLVCRRLLEKKDQDRPRFHRRCRSLVCRTRNHRWDRY